MSGKRISEFESIQIPTDCNEVEYTEVLELPPDMLSDQEEILSEVEEEVERLEDDLEGNDDDHPYIKEENDFYSEYEVLNVDVKEDDGDSEIQSESQSVDLYNCSYCNQNFTDIVKHIRKYHHKKKILIQFDDDDSDTETITSDQIPVGKNFQEEFESNIIVRHSASKIKEEIDKTETEYEYRDDGSDNYDYKSDISIQINEEFESQDDMNPENELHSCEIGQYQTDNLVSLNNHIQTKHSLNWLNLNDDELETTDEHEQPKEKAQRTTNRQRTVAETGSVINPEDDESRICDVCNTVFHNSKALKLHLRMHANDKPKVSEQVEYEQRLQLNNKKMFRCEECHKCFEQSHYEIHKKSHSANILSCSICNRQFENAFEFDMHSAVHQEHRTIKQTSTKIKRYPCQYCGQKFGRPHEKVKHERIHTGEKPHECEICGKTFRIAYSLTVHLRTHTNVRPYACPICDRRFKSHSVYDHHLNIHNTERKFKCPYCPKAFKTSVQLAGHKNSHIKPYSCTICSRPFSTLYMVRKHIEQHDLPNSLPHVCSECGAAYARSFALRDHTEEAHSEKAFVVLASDLLITDNTDEGAVSKVNTVQDDEQLMVDVDDSEHFENEEVITDWV